MPFFHRYTSYFMPSEKKNVFGRAASHACTSSFMRNTCKTIFQFFYPFVETPLRQNTLPVLCWKSSTDFGPRYTFRPQKNGSLNAALPWCKLKVERPRFNVTVAKKGTDLATSNLHSCDKKETKPSDARENDSAANRNTNATALRIIIDSPSYIL